MRIDKFLANNSPYTRSQVRKLIREQRVTVNEALASNPAQHIDAQMLVAVDGQAVNSLQGAYYMLFKPQGYVCSTEDPENPIALDLFPESLHGYGNHSLHYAGRLDKDTTGLLLVTNDGQWSHRITSPRHDCAKTYAVTLADAVTETQLAPLREGILLRNDTSKTRPALIERITEYQLEVTISEGRYHQVKRMFAAIGNKVITLHRHKVGAIGLDPILAAGEYRALSTDEIQSVYGLDQNATDNASTDTPHD